MPNKVVFITSGTSFTMPADFGTLVSLEAIGAGGNGNGGGGAGGGAYAKVITVGGLSAGAAVSVQIGAGGGTSGSGTSPTANTWFKDGSTLVAAGGTSAGGGGAGGTTANSVGATKFAGGNAALGGGGAGGPNGAGGAAVGSTGGSGDNGSGGAGGSTGVDGGNGAEWTQTSNSATAGSGGGGGDGGGGQGGNGGNYGGGGGSFGSFGGGGAAGIIVLTYITSFIPGGKLLATAAILAASYSSSVSAYPFIGGQQPYAPRVLNPSITAVAVNEPPYQHPARTAQQVAIAVQAAQPDPWAYAAAGGLAPYLPRVLSSGISGLHADNPPFGIPPGWLSGVAQAWQPEVWPTVFMGSRQAYEPARLNPSLTAVQVDDPPFQHPEHFPSNRSTRSAWQPDPWIYAPSGAAQPYSPRNLNPSLTAVQVDNPPFRYPERLPANLSSKTAWQPDPWPLIFTGGSQPYDQRRLTPSIHGIVRNDPPFQYPGRWAGLPPIIGRWQPDPWPPAFLGGRQPYDSARLNPSITAVEVDNPPFGIPNLTILSNLLTQWQPDSWPPVFLGAGQAYEQKKLSPGLPGQSADPPPFSDPAREQLAASIIAGWQPNSWVYAFFGARQPFEPKKLSPGTPGVSVSNPPFLHPAKWPVNLSTKTVWQPDPWPPSFMGGLGPYTFRRLPPALINVFPRYNQILRNVIVRVRCLAVPTYGGYANRDFDTTDTNESTHYGFDFNNVLTGGDVISSVACLLTVQSGTDTAPSSRLIGSPLISGAVVRQRIATLVAGTTYTFAMIATLKSGSVVTVFSHLTCGPIY